MKEHASDCALHNGPAEIPDYCSCGADRYMHPLVYGSEYPSRADAIEALFQYITTNAPEQDPGYVESDNHGDSRDNAVDRAYWYLAQMVKNIPAVPCYTVDGKRV